MKHGRAVVGVAGVVLALAGCGGSSQAAGGSAAASIDIGGSFSLISGDSIVHPDGQSGPCVGMRGYSDINTGTGITVRNAAGTVVGTSTLGGGVYDAAAFACRFVWSARVPAADFYQVEVSHRGSMTVTRADAEARRISMRLG